MQITTRELELQVDGRPMRVRVAEPTSANRFPGILLYSEIFQLTAPIRRSMERLAGHGFVVAAPEIFHRVEPPGTVIEYDDAGRERGLADARRTTVAEHDRDREAMLDFLERDARVVPGALGAMGFCIGGHLALRAALDARVRATVACYPTGVHDGKLGADADAGTLAELHTLRGDVLVVFGERDPHVPLEGRDVIQRGLVRLGKRACVRHHAAEHAFMRDEGARYDPAAADATWAEAIDFFHQCFSR
ncbi:MAG: dienelactone hydrolase family protein [Planctomycetes bacterium]|nr:dienelactone hydrolase family protein [Planctomycetota bacterium]